MTGKALQECTIKSFNITTLHFNIYTLEIVFPNTITSPIKMLIKISQPY